MRDLAALTRRAFLGRAASGLGGVALGSLLGSRGFAGDGDGKPAAHWPGVIKPLHFPAKAKRVIWLGQMGGPSQLETFDHKPKLRELDGQPMPESYTKGQPIAQLQGQALKILGPRFDFRKVGKSGQEISEILPHHHAIADDICIIRSLTTEAIN